MPTSEAVLAFWFQDPTRAWKKDPAFDAEIRDRFGDLHTAVTEGQHEAWRATPRGALAYVIVLDQFSRNLFRDDARTFATDRQARDVAEATIAAGHDRALTQQERGFLYMPFMHSEVLSDQDRSVALFDEAPTYQRDFAQQHRDIIARFGRFPHRNEVLGRASTPEELEFLKQPGSSF